MQAGVVEALRPLRPTAQRQVVLLTDGLVGFESEIVATVARDLPAGSRLHAVAVGSAPNRALTGPAARAGRGVEVVTGRGGDADGCGPRDRADRARLPDRDAAHLLGGGERGAGRGPHAARAPRAHPARAAGGHFRGGARAAERDLRSPAGGCPNDDEVLRGVAGARPFRHDMGRARGGEVADPPASAPSAPMPPVTRRSPRPAAAPPD